MGDQLLLRGEPGHHRHLDVGEQAAQGGHARHPEGAGPVDKGLSPRRRGIAQDGVHRHGEGIGQDGEFVGHGVGHGNQHRIVGRQQLRPRPGGVGGHPDVDTGAELPGGEAPTQAQVPGGTGGAGGIDAARCAGEPRVEHHPVADLHPPRLGTELHHLGHHLVSGDVGQRREGGHGVVDVAFAEVPHDEFGVGSADSRQDGSRHHPVGSDHAGVVDDMQAEGQGEQKAVEVVGRLRSPLVRVRRRTEDERLHRPAFTSAAAFWDRWNVTIPAMNLSMSATLAWTTAFMSGRKCSKCSSSMASAIPTAVSSAGTRAP